MHSYFIVTASIMLVWRLTSALQHTRTRNHVVVHVVIRLHYSVKKNRREMTLIYLMYYSTWMRWKMAFVISLASLWWCFNVASAGNDHTKRMDTKFAEYHWTRTLSYMFIATHTALFNGVILRRSIKSMANDEKDFGDCSLLKIIISFLSTVFTAARLPINLCEVSSVIGHSS